MKSVGELLQSARKRKNLSLEGLSAELGMETDVLARWENGDQELEKWARALADIAIALSVPTSRLISRTGRFRDAEPGQCGVRIREAREKRGLAKQELAKKAGLSPDEYDRVERGESPLEEFGPALLKMAEVVDLPVFNLLYGY